MTSEAAPRAQARVPHVRARGTPFAIGQAHGRALSPALRAFLGDSLCRLNRLLPEPVSMRSLRPVLEDYQAAIAAAVPGLAAEIAGLADGAGISVPEAVLLQARREILGYHRVPAHGDCTAYARAGARGGPVLAQTIDLNGRLADQIAVLDVTRDGPGPRRAIVLSFGGLLGYLGMNSGGLAVGLNLVLGGQWGPGLPPYLAIRHLLDTAASVEEAIARLRGLLPLASSRTIMLCDSAGAAAVEILGGELRVIAADEVVHANHFLHPDLAPADQLNVFARRSSLRRLDACRAGLGAIAGDADAERHFALLSAPPVRVAAKSDIRQEETVAAVVMLPAKGEFHVRAGDPAAAPTRTFRLLGKPGQYGRARLRERHARGSGHAPCP